MFAATDAACPSCHYNLRGHKGGVCPECGRRLIQLAPYHESGYRILMEALEQRSNNAEALLVYDRLRVLLRDGLGTAPSSAVQRVYRRVLAGTTTTAP